MYLQLAILATSIRYSSKACWRDCKEEAIDKYACLSWDIISASGLALVDEPDISVVQAIALLSIIDTIGELSDMNTCQNGMGFNKDIIQPAENELPGSKLEWQSESVKI